MTINAYTSPPGLTPRPRRAGVRVFRVVIIALGVLFLFLAFARLNVREVDKTGLCGSIVQGSSHDDGGSSTHDCNRLRHDDGIATTAFLIVALASLGVGVGHILYVRRGS
jgi:hypothetical protein